jgi:RecA/RadA recombinase
MSEAVKKPTKKVVDPDNFQEYVNSTATARERDERETLGDDWAYSVLKEIRETNPYADILKGSALHNWQPKDCLSTGVMALNAIISGKLDVGMPPKVLGIAGESQSGKTFIILEMMREAQSLGIPTFLLDSEGAITDQVVAHHGINPAKVIKIPVKYVQQAVTAINRILGGLEKINFVICPKTGKAIPVPDNKFKKAFIALDSLGNLTIAGDGKAAETGTATMGSSAKEIKNMFKQITLDIDKNRSTLVFTNHIYDKPAEMYPGQVAKQGGGKAPIYMATVLLQFNKGTLYKTTGGTKEAIGMKITAFATKNRICPNLFKVDLEITPDGGINRYSGMIEFGIEAGVLKSGSYLLPVNAPDGGFPKLSRTNYEGNTVESNARIKRILEYPGVMDGIKKYLEEQLTYTNVNRVFDELGQVIEAVVKDDDGEEDAEQLS